MRDDLDSSVTSLIRLVHGLGRTADILYVGAHPDDEDSALIAMLAGAAGGACQPDLPPPAGAPGV